MGKSSLIMVLGAGLIISFLILGLGTNSTRSVDTTVDYFKENQARLIANSGIEIYLEKLRRNKTLTGTFNDNDLLGGEYDISISGPDTALVIRANGKFMGVEHTSIANAKRSPIKMPDVNSALYISSDNLSLNLNGNLDIDGRDRNIDGTLGPNPSLPGIGVDDPSDSAYVINNIKSKISNAINGEGGAPSVRTVEDNTDWLKITENIIFAADITLPTGTYSSGNLGTPSEPKITYVDGDVHFSGTIEGDGILVVNGNLDLSGTFTYRGMIIVYGNSTISTKVVGQGAVYGTTICVGQNVDIHATGNAKLYYSTQAIENAKVNLKSSRFLITSWWE